MKKGKLIVLDGTDGSGKATQAKILVKRLSKEGYKVQEEDFPQYGKLSAGPIQEYLSGHYGSPQAVGPYIPSILYAVDRYAAGNRIRKALQRGCVVVANRYVTANLAHQGGKIGSAKQRQQFFKWVLGLEYGLFKIPKPDLNIVLHMPAAIAQKLVDRKARRSYLKGRKRDIHESDLSHLRAAEKTYLEIASRYGYPIIECYQKGQILSPKQIGELVWNKVKRAMK